jgi:cytochrome c-type biogenesis protein CcmH
MRALATLLLLLGLGLAAPAGAIEPGEQLADPAQEARARELGRVLRCLVCQNQSIDDSNAPLAQDLRRLVRERIAAGDSDAQVIAHVHARYGDFVLLRPPVRPGTWLLWFGPALLLAAGAAVIVVRARRRRSAALAPAPLSDEERRRLHGLLPGDGGGRG